MTEKESFTISADPFEIEDYLIEPSADAVVSEILSGLQSSPRRISSRFFYDDIGSQLFEEITHLPEYYPARTEKKLLAEWARLNCDLLRDLDIVELGSGDCSKISILLDEVTPSLLETIRYIPLDVSRSALRKSADILLKRYSGLTVRGVVADFLSQLHHIPGDRDRFFCFLGSTIGNMDKHERATLLGGIGRTMTPNDRLLLGVDMLKPKEIMTAAYNDGREVTAAFNRNILSVVNSIIGTNFDPNRFNHVAIFNEKKSRIEMHLQAQSEMIISSPYVDENIAVRNGEMIHTENSHKFTLEGIREELNRAGLNVVSSTTDSQRWFSLLLITG